MLLVLLSIPIAVIADWSAYAYVGTLAGHVVTAVSVLAVVGGVWKVMTTWDEEDYDPLSADRRSR
jgi:uncharacterized membrane protein YqjE